MSAIGFDPWAALKCKVGDTTPANPANPPKGSDTERAIGAGLDGLGDLAGRASPEYETATSPPATADPDDEAPPAPSLRLPMVPLDVHAEQLAAAMFANPDTAMGYLRPIARTRLADLDMYSRGLLIGVERHRLRLAPSTATSA